MSALKRKEEHYWRNFFARIGLVIATVCIIVWFLPREEGQQFHYDINKPWMYGSFIAKFDFPIYKTEETIRSERDSMLRQFQPYYRYDPSIEQEEIEKFKSDFKEGVPGLSPEYMATIIDRLHRLYTAGIMYTPEYNAIYKDTTSMIRVVSGKKAQSVQLNCFYSTMGAYEKLFKDSVLSKQKLILQRCNLNDYIEPNLIYEKNRTESERNDMLSSIPLASGMVLSGQKIIDQGEIIDDYAFRVLNSFEKEMKRRESTQIEITTTYMGQTLYVFILVLIFSVYMVLFRKDYFEKTRNIAMIYAMITIFPIFVSIIMKHSIFNVYIIPFTMGAIFIRVFMDSRTAFVAHTIMILISAIAVKYQYEFIAVQLVSGLVAIYSLRDLSRRAQVFKTAIYVALASSAIYLALQLIQTNSLSELDKNMYKYFAINGIFLLLVYPLMFLIEKTFGFISNVTLFELSNTNKGVLRDLSEIAPGTFQHSITVGNLAAEIANRIGANSLLVRTGALYHDIGKMNNPVFFTENQAGVNPHDNIPYQESARIIISHVTDGLRLAEKYGLPSIIKNFITTHHGLGLTKYFYIKYKNEHPNEDIDQSVFQYPGPNPFTREQAILMMADTVEAASRSLPEYTEESISNLVNKLIDGQLADGYYTECPITFRDIYLAKNILIDRLKAIYHTRIQYPELKK